jgi:hypothetical protein
VVSDRRTTPGRFPPGATGKPPRGRTWALAFGNGVRGGRTIPPRADRGHSFRMAVAVEISELLAMNSPRGSQLTWL